MGITHVFCMFIDVAHMDEEDDEQQECMIFVPNSVYQCVKPYIALFCWGKAPIEWAHICYILARNIINKI
jgi:hypothetical protein